MLAYDQPVFYGGLTFRVRTEHREAENIRNIVTTVLFEGRLVATRVEPCEQSAAEAKGVRLCSTMAQQHRAVLIDLTHGKLDENISNTPGTGEFHAIHAVEGAIDEQQKINTPDVDDLDDIVQDLYIVDLLSQGIEGAEESEIANELSLDFGAAPQNMPATAEDNMDFVSDAAIDEFGEFNTGPTTAVRIQHRVAFGKTPKQNQAAFTGDLSQLSISDLLEFLSVSKRTGTVVAVGRNGISEIHLNNGMIASAVCAGCQNIGSVLLKQGVVTKKQIEDAEETLHSTDKSKAFCSVLIEQGAVNEVQIQTALESQISCVLTELVGWKSGHFTFVPGTTGTALLGQGRQIAVNARGALLDALRAIDEQNKEDGTNVVCGPPHAAK